MILVTGAAGHLGNVLVRELIAAEEKVRALVYPGEPLSSLHGMLIEVIVGDVGDRELMNRAMQGVDSVFHLAGIIAIRPGMEELMHQVNVEGTRTVAEVALENKIRRFIHVSSVHAFKHESSAALVDETTPLALDSPPGSYDRTKAEGTKLVLDLVTQGLNAIVACPSGIIGLHDYTGSEMGKALLSFSNNKPDILVDGSYDFVDVRDVVRGLLLAREKGTIGEIYILSGAQASVENLCLMAQAATGTRSSKIMVPIRFQGLVSWLKIKSRYTVYSLQTLLESSAFSSLKARRELGYQARPLADAVTDFINWTNLVKVKGKETNEKGSRKGVA